MRIKFVCTGMCCADHPIHEHCKDCHHAEFKAVVPYKRGRCEIWHNMLHGPMFYIYDKGFYPSENSKLWKAWKEVCEFGNRNCKYWYQRDQKQKGGE